MQCIHNLPRSGIRNLASKEEENRGRRSVNMQILRSTLPLVIFKQKIHYGLVTRSKQSKMCIKILTLKYEGDNLMQKFRGKHHLGISNLRKIRSREIVTRVKCVIT